MFFFVSKVDLLLALLATVLAFENTDFRDKEHWFQPNANSSKRTLYFAFTDNIRTSTC